MMCDVGATASCMQIVGAENKYASPFFVCVVSSIYLIYMYFSILPKRLAPAPFATMASTSLFFIAIPRTLNPQSLDIASYTLNVTVTMASRKPRNKT